MSGVAHNIKSAVDAFGTLKAQAAEIETRMAELRQVLIDAGIGAYVGDSFVAHVTHSQRGTLDMAAVREKLSKQFIAAHTRTTDVWTVRIGAKQ